MLCVKCKKEIPEASLYCNFCGKKQASTPRKRAHKRCNGSGTIRKDPRYCKPYIAISAADALGHRKYIGSYPSYQAAQAALDDYVRRGCPDAYNATLEDIYKLWADAHYKQVEERTAKNYGSLWARFVPLYKRKIAELKTPDFQAVIDTATGKSTAQSLKSLAQMLCRYAVENDFVMKNYADFVVLPKIAKKDKVIFTADQITELWRHTDDKRVQVVLSMIYMGFRVGEIYALRVSDIHLSDGYVVGGEKTEAGKNRVIPFPPSIPEIKTFFAGWISEADGGKLFSDASIAIFSCAYFYDPLFEYGIMHGKYKGGLRYDFADNPHLTPHSTRHTFASLSAAAGMRPDDLQKIIGHAKYETTANIYVHKNIEQLTAEMSKLKKPKCD